LFVTLGRDRRCKRLARRCLDGWRNDFKALSACARACASRARDDRAPEKGPRLLRGPATARLAGIDAHELAPKVFISRQLESVYRAGFLDTAEGRDLDQLVTLVGVARRTRTHAVGTVIFSRSTLAVADIAIPAGTRLSTAEAPVVVFETTEPQTLRRIHQLRDSIVRVREGDATGYGIFESIVTGAWPDFGLSAGTSFV
jgi:hypothetical protein